MVIPWYLYNILSWVVIERVYNNNNIIGISNDIIVLRCNSIYNRSIQYKCEISLCTQHRIFYSSIRCVFTRSGRKRHGVITYYYWPFKNVTRAKQVNGRFSTIFFFRHGENGGERGGGVRSR